MKHYISIILLLLPFFSVISCNKIAHDSIYVSTTELQFTKLGGVTKVITDPDISIALYEVKESGEILRQTASTSMDYNCLSLDWITTEVTNGEVIVTVEPNETNNQRYAVIHVLDPLGMHSPVDIKICQE